MTGHGRYVYLALNTTVGLMAFGRNLLFLGIFDLADLGQIALMQTIVMLVGFSQVGLLSGAFILWAGGDRVLNASIANVLFAGKFALAVLVVAGIALLGADVLAPNIAPETLIIGLAAGVASMASSWMNNALIAEQRLIHSSAVNIVAVTVSLAAALATLYTPDLRLALLAVALQPVLVMLGVLAINSGVRPTSLRPAFATVRKILAVGSKVYLGSLATLLLYQVERWSIVGVLGPEALGRYYIVILYLGFFSLIPIALMNINFPRAIRAVKAGEDESFRRIRRRHALELTVFAVAALAFKLAFLVPVLTLALPQFLDSSPLVYLAFAAGVTFMAQDLGTLVLYAVQRTGPILTAGLLALGVFSIAVAGLWLVGIFDLSTILYARIVASAIGASWLFAASTAALNGHDWSTAKI